MSLQKLPHTTIRALVGLLALACTVTVGLFASPGAPAAARPDIVVIQTDDMTRSDLYSLYTNPLTGVVSTVMPNTLNLLVLNVISATATTEMRNPALAAV